jgi:type VI secretion system secreted protein Hcp
MIYTPIYITKTVEMSSPLLFQAMNTHELLQVTIRFWRPSQTGQEVQYFTIELLDAYINSIHMYIKDNKNPDYMQYPMMEEISFVYSRITFTYEDGGITAEGDWPSGRV